MTGLLSGAHLLNDYVSFVGIRRGAMSATVDEAAVVHEYRLTEDNELRFEVATSGDVVLELVDGMAEVFGTELVQHKRYSFPAGARVAVFTWHGCVVELIGKTDSAYIAKHTPMVSCPPTRMVILDSLLVNWAYIARQYLAPMTG
jgi:hypothetical protein